MRFMTRSDQCGTKPAHAQRRLWKKRARRGSQLYSRTPRHGRILLSEGCRIWPRGNLKVSDDRRQQRSSPAQMLLHQSGSGSYGIVGVTGCVGFGTVAPTCCGRSSRTGPFPCTGASQTDPGRASSPAAAGRPRRAARVVRYRIPDSKEDFTLVQRCLIRSRRRRPNAPRFITNGGKLRPPTTRSRPTCRDPGPCSAARPRNSCCSSSTA